MGIKAIANSRKPFVKDARSSRRLSATRAKTLTTVVNYESGNRDERSFILLRRRYGSGRGHVLVLKGDFMSSFREGLLSALDQISCDSEPLTLDLRAVVRLDATCEEILLQFREAQAARREVILNLPLFGPAAHLSRRLHDERTTPSRYQRVSVLSP